LGISQIVHIPIIALINLGIIYFWNLKVRNRAFRSPSVWGLSFFGSLFNVWGQDVVQRDFVVESVPNMVLVSAGCWIVFVLATNAKYLAIYGWSKRDFWLDCVGDLISFIISGILIYLAT
jgi:hypothetical protein